jgi:hypothetical protein
MKQTATETAHSRLKQLWIQKSNQTGIETLHPTEAWHFIPAIFLEIHILRLLIFFPSFQTDIVKSKYVLYIVQHQSDCKVHKFTHRTDNIPLKHNCLLQSL